MNFYKNINVIAFDADDAFRVNEIVKYKRNGEDFKTVNRIKNILEFL